MTLPWGYTSNTMLEEIRNMTGPIEFQGSVRASPAQWTKDVIAEAFQVEAAGEGIPAKVAFETYQEYFFGSPNASDGWKYSNCREEELRDVLHFLIPLIFPAKPNCLNVKYVAMVIDCLYGNKQTSWAEIFREAIAALVKNLDASHPESFLPAFVVHLYQAKDVLTAKEIREYRALLRMAKLGGSDDKATEDEAKEEEDKEREDEPEPSIREDEEDQGGPSEQGAPSGQGGRAAPSRQTNPEYEPLPTITILGMRTPGAAPILLSISQGFPNPHLDQGSTVFGTLHERQQVDKWMESLRTKVTSYKSTLKRAVEVLEVGQNEVVQTIWEPKDTLKQKSQELETLRKVKEDSIQKAKRMRKEIQLQGELTAKLQGAQEVAARLIGMDWKSVLLDTVLQGWVSEGRSITKFAFSLADHANDLK
jgi:hypothetical protein